MRYDARFRRHMERHTSKSIPQGGKEFNAESHTPCTQIFLYKKKKLRGLKILPFCVCVCV